MYNQLWYNDVSSKDNLKQCLYEKIEDKNSMKKDVKGSLAVKVVDLKEYVRVRRKKFNKQDISTAIVYQENEGLLDDMQDEVQPHEGVMSKEDIYPQEEKYPQEDMYPQEEVLSEEDKFLIKETSSQTIDHKNDDERIIDLFYARDERAIEETKRKFEKRLFHTSMNILKNQEDVEECISDTYMKAWAAIPPTRPEALGAYLNRIVRNLSINRWKSKGAARRGAYSVDVLLSELGEAVPSTMNGNPEEEYEAHVLTDELNLFLGTLKKIDRVVFVLRYFQGEKILAIAERFEMSESKVKSLLHRTRKKLKSHLENVDISVE